MIAPNLEGVSGLARSWWVLALAVLAAAGSAGANGAGNGAQGGLVVPAVVLAVLAVLTVLLHRWPVAAIAGNAALVTAYFALGYADGPIYLSMPLATFVVASHRVPRDWWPWSVGAVFLIAGGQAARAVLGGRGWQDTAWQMLGEAAMTAAAGAIGTALRARREARHDRVQRAASEERLRMAQDLHDGVGHRLAVIAMQAGVALHVLDKEPAKARQSLETIRDQSRDALDELRAELARMSGDSPQRRPAPGIDGLAALVERVRAGGLRVDLNVAAGDLPGSVDHAAYLIVQESLTNVLRHAQATRVAVGLERLDDQVVVTVADDGNGGALTGQDGGMGISGMRSRAEALGGALEAGRSIDGFRIRAVLPVGPP